MIENNAPTDYNFNYFLFFNQLLDTFGEAHCDYKIASGAAGTENLNSFLKFRFGFLQGS